MCDQLGGKLFNAVICTSRIDRDTRTAKFGLARLQSEGHRGVGIGDPSDEESPEKTSKILICLPQGYPRCFA